MKISILIVPFFAACVAACGGGGGDDKSDATPSTVVSTASFPISAAITAYLQSSSSLSAAGSDTASAGYTLTVSRTPGVSTTFEGHPATSSFQTVVIKRNGNLVDQFVSTSFDQQSPYLAIGSIDQGDGEYTVSDVSTPLYLPTTAKVGQSGALNPDKAYANSSKSTLTRTITHSWELVADTANTAFLCFHLQSTPVTTGSAFAESDCFKINTSGVVIGLRASLTEGGQTINFQ